MAHSESNQEDRRGDVFRLSPENYVATQDVWFNGRVVPSAVPNFIPNPAMNVCGSSMMEVIIHIKMSENNFVVRVDDPDYLKYFYMRG